MVELAKAGKLHELEVFAPAEYVRYYRTWQQIYLDNQPPIEPRPFLNNFGIWGKTGAGKSRYVRETHHYVVYPKMRNKWWDGYEGQDVIVIEELSPDDYEWITPLLKIGCDHYAFMAESKGKCKAIRPKIIYITSNYSMYYIFKRPEDYDSLVRRFEEVEMICYRPAEVDQYGTTINPEILDFKGTLTIKS